MFYTDLRARPDSMDCTKTKLLLVYACVFGIAGVDPGFLKRGFKCTVM